MGVEIPGGASQALTPPDETYFKSLNDDLADKGFLVTKAEDLINWARTGSLW